LINDYNESGRLDHEKENEISCSVTLFYLALGAAVINVNIYFPEKDVKEAYKLLEKELMDRRESLRKRPAGENRRVLCNSNWSHQHMHRNRPSGQNCMKREEMPDVVNAYKEMGARIADIDRLRGSGLVG